MLALVGQLEVAAGLLVVVMTGAGMLATFVLPRGHSVPQLIGTTATKLVRTVVVFICRPVKEYRRRDALLAGIGPIALLVQLVMFLLLFVLGYAIALLSYAGSFGNALRQASSSLFSIGLAHASGPGNDVLAVMAAATGAIAIALQIGYLPAIYQAFNRREALVTLMESRAGLPAWGPEVLARHELIHTLDALPQLYRDWELWSADLAESHVTYPVLLYFRSPEPYYSWILAVLAILDAGAMQLALNPSTAPSEARMCLRMGFTALRRIAATLRLAYDTDPLPEGPISISFEEFSYAVEILQQVGYEAERDLAEAWPHFVGWRVNYGAVAEQIADRVLAPRAPWSGERTQLPEALARPNRPPHRSPGGRTANESRFRPPP
jgi:hypothetical protein